MKLSFILTLFLSVVGMNVSAQTDKTIGNRAAGGDLILETATGGAGITLDGTTSAATIEGGIKADTIDEKTGAAGVTIDSVLLKDNTVTATTITGNTSVVTDTITEKTGAAGVTVEGGKHIDGKLFLNSPSSGVSTLVVNKSNATFGLLLSETPTNNIALNMYSIFGNANAAEIKLHTNDLSYIVNGSPFGFGIKIPTTSLHVFEATDEANIRAETDGSTLGATFSLFSDSGVAFMTLRSSAGGAGFPSADTLVIGTDTADDVVFVTNGSSAERMRIESGGDITITNNLTVSGSVKATSLYSIQQSSATTINGNIDYGNLVIPVGTSGIISIVANRSGASTGTQYRYVKAQQSGIGSCLVTDEIQQLTGADLIGTVSCTNNGGDTIIRVVSQNTSGSSTSYDVSVTRFK